MIGKFETIAKDTEYIKSEVGLEFGTKDFPWSNKKGSVTSVAREYFKEIDAESKRKLYEIYRIDFEMFGYSPEEYFGHVV